MEMFYVLVLFRVGYHEEMIGHNTRKVLLLFLFLFLIIRMLFLSAIFPCYCSCFEKVTSDSSEKEL